MRLQSAIFDMDGTLLDSMPIWRDLGTSVLRGLGIEPEPETDEMLKTLSLRHGIAYCKEHYHLPQTEEELIGRVVRAVDAFAPDALVLYTSDHGEMLHAHGLMSKGVKLQSEDVFARAGFILSAKSLDPQFQGQTKEKLTSRDAFRLVSSFVRPQFEIWLNAHLEDGKKLAELVNKQALSRQRQMKKVEKKRGSTVAVLPGKLTDCESTDIEHNEIFLVEGDSAGGTAKQGRDKEYQAILPLRGKVLNTWEVDADRIFASQIIHDIAVALGVDPHKLNDPNVDLKGLRYGKVCILADADVDGSHIQVLLLTLFYRHFPKLISQGHVFIAQPPLYRIDVPKVGKKAEKKLYCADDKELKRTLSKLEKDGIKAEKLNISRFKGLGEMSEKQLAEAAFHPDTRHLLPVTLGDLEKSQTDAVMTLLMAKGEAQGRRLWMETHGEDLELDI